MRKSNKKVWNIDTLDTSQKTYRKNLESKNSSSNILYITSEKATKPSNLKNDSEINFDELTL